MTAVDHGARMSRVRKSLDGLSVGDSFGERFFGPPDKVQARIAAHEFPPGLLKYTDDTVMAISIVDVLERFGQVNQYHLSKLFAMRFSRDPLRGYGSTAFGILDGISKGESWKVAAQRVFDGKGSKGNGAAMRAAPIGAYFGGDLRGAAENARLSAEITHTHPEGIAGAIAVAVAAAHISGGGNLSDLFTAVLSMVAPTATRTAIEEASALLETDHVQTAVLRLGNGSRILSEDTVPFCLWCVARSELEYETALWRTVAGLGDRDTTCAIVGGIIASSAKSKIPISWLAARESLATFQHDSKGPTTGE